MLGQFNTAKPFVIELFASSKKWIFSLLLISIMAGAFLMLRPYVLKVIIDRAHTIRDRDVIGKLIQPMILYISLSLISILMFRLRDYIYLKLNNSVEYFASVVMMQKILQHSVSVFQNNFSGDLADKIKDVMYGMPVLLKKTDELISTNIVLMFAVCMFWTINHQLSFLLMVWLCFFIAMSLYATKNTQILSTHIAELSSLTAGHLVDILANITSIKLFSRSYEEVDKLKTLVKSKIVSENKRGWYLIKIFTVLGLSFVSYQIIGFVLLINLFKIGKISTGDFALFVSMNITIIHELWLLPSRILSMVESMTNIVHGSNIALQATDIVDKNNAMPLQVTTGMIIFDQVTFNYSGADKIFNNKSVTINAREKVGLVGYSGSGKTTFINLILRLYDIKEGKILIDSQNIKDVTQDSLHNNISVIPQDTILFHRTLMENIRYGRHDASEEEVYAAAKKATAHEFILKLPNQYNYVIGEKGIKLSSGQRQRIAIARAILKDAPILILDEATSQLDSITENEIQTSILDLMQNKTTLIIAHRLSTLLQMDRILVFSNGVIVENGTHSVLLSRNGLYRKLWNEQFRSIRVSHEILVSDQLRAY